MLNNSQKKEKFWCLYP